MSDRLYCELSTVKRLLRSAGSRESRVRFSESYKDLGPDSSNSGTILLSGVSFLDEFDSHETFTFTFTSATNFIVAGDILGYIGSGSTSSLFTASGRFTVPAANWSGVAEIGDKVYITANSDISNDDGEGFIEDATKKINTHLERIFGSLDNVAFYSDETVDIPDAISFACSRFAAYEIFNSIFSSVNDEKSPVEKLNILAEETLETYLQSHGRGPIWQSRENLVNEIGVSGVGDGIIEIDNLTDPKNQEYRR
jgi:hypothetical protein